MTLWLLLACVVGVAVAFDDEALDAALEYAELCAVGEGLDPFIRRVSPRHPPPPHIAKHLIPKLEEAQWRPLRLIITMPPRHAKTVTVLHFLAWWMAKYPGTLSSYASYGQDLSNQKSRILRALVRAAGMTLAKDSTAVGEWHLAEDEGGLIATSVRGPMTGKGITGVSVIDDPFKDRADAESDIVRESVWSWFTDVAYTRLEPGASCIVILTRWHDDDLAGRLLGGMGELGDEWEVVNLPAVANDNGIPCASNDNGARALWDRYPLEHLRKIEKTIGPYSWASLYQQQPVPKGGRLFAKDPPRFSLKTFKLDGHRIAIGADPAATEDTKADWSVGVYGAMKGYGVESHFYILEVWRRQCTVPEFARLLAWAQKQKKAKLAVEAVAGFKAVPQMLREIVPDLDMSELVPSVSKFIRWQPMAAAWADDRVHVPNDADAEWVPAFLGEMRKLTGVKDKVDDQGDGAAHCFNELYREEKVHGMRAVANPRG